MEHVILGVRPNGDVRSRISQCALWHSFTIAGREEYAGVAPPRAMRLAGARYANIERGVCAVGGRLCVGRAVRLFLCKICLPFPFFSPFCTGIFVRCAAATLSNLLRAALYYAFCVLSMLQRAVFACSSARSHARLRNAQVPGPSCQDLQNAFVV